MDRDAVPETRVVVDQRDTEVEQRLLGHLGLADPAPGRPVGLTDDVEQGLVPDADEGRAEEAEQGAVVARVAEVSSASSRSNTSRRS